MDILLEIIKSIGLFAIAAALWYVGQGIRKMARIIKGTTVEVTEEITMKANETSEAKEGFIYTPPLDEDEEAIRIAKVRELRKQSGKDKTTN